MTEERVQPVTDKAELLDVAPCGFASFADDGTILLANRRLLQLLDYQEHELVGQHVDHILTVPARIFYQTHFFPLIRLHGKADEIYFTLKTRAGASVPVFANAVRGDLDGVTVNHCVFLPLYQRERYEDELLNAKRAAEEALRRNQQLVADANRARADAETANRAKSAFLAMMSHEIRTPINAILGYGQLLEMELEKSMNERQRSYLDGVQVSTRHLLAVINDILDLAKIESGSMTVAKEVHALREVIERSVAMTEPQAVARGLRLRNSCRSDLNYSGDEDRVVQIIVNLLSNAVKFTEPGGNITLECGSELDDGLFVRVRDTGSGIAAEDIERIFEPFVQVAGPLQKNARGTGLGLAISRRFARLMGGDLTVASELNKGSTFTLQLRKG